MDYPQWPTGPPLTDAQRTGGFVRRSTRYIIAIAMAVIFYLLSVEILRSSLPATTPDVRGVVHVPSSAKVSPSISFERELATGRNKGVRERTFFTPSELHVSALANVGPLLFSSLLSVATFLALALSAFVWRMRRNRRRTEAEQRAGGLRREQLQNIAVLVLCVLFGVLVNAEVVVAQECGSDYCNSACPEYNECSCNGINCPPACSGSDYCNSSCPILWRPKR